VVPKGYRAITIDEEVFELLTKVMVEYDCDSIAESIEKSANAASEQDASELAQARDDSRYLRDLLPGKAVCVDGADRVLPFGSRGWLPAPFRR
jgi:hypothetical protein